MAESSNDLNILLGADFTDLEQRFANILETPHIEPRVCVDYRGVEVDQVAGEQFRDELRDVEVGDVEFYPANPPPTLMHQRIIESTALQTRLSNNGSPVQPDDYLYVHGEGVVAIKPDKGSPFSGMHMTDQVSVLGRVHACLTHPYARPTGEMVHDSQGNRVPKTSLRHGAVLILKDAMMTTGELGTVVEKDKELLVPLSANTFGWGYMPGYRPDN